MKAKLRRGVAGTASMAGILMAGALYATPPRIEQSAGDSLPVGVELQRSPLDALVENNKFLDDKDLKLHFDRGRIRAGNKQYKEAIDDFSECIRHAPENAANWTARGVAWGLQGEYEKAIHDFDRAIQLKPEFGYAYNARGLCRLANWNAEGASDDFEQFVARDPQAVAFAFRGLAKMSRIKHREAIEDFDRARELDPNGPQILLWRAMARFNKREYAWAIEDLDQMLALRPKNAAEAIFCRGLTWGQIGQTAKAYDDLHKASQLEPRFLNQMHLLKATNPEFIVSVKNMEWKFNIVGQSRAPRPSPLTPPTPAKMPQTPSTPASASTERNRTAQLHSGSPRVEAPWLSSDDQETVKNLTHRAWLWATSRYKSGRDGVRAVEAAREACELTEWRVSGCIESLAAAYAECGDFESADKFQSLALEVWPKYQSGRHKGERRLQRYRAHEPLQPEDVIIGSNQPSEATTAQQLAQQPAQQSAQQPAAAANSAGQTNPPADANAANSIADATAQPTSTTKPPPIDEGPRMVAPWLSAADFETVQDLTNQAWLWATSRYESGRDGVRAVEAARGACERTEWKASACLEALAAAYAECGDFESADKYQTWAVELATAAELKGRYVAARRLAHYRDRRPIHQGE